MTDFAKPPKLLKWPVTMAQHYSQGQKILVAAGCSFTAASDKFDGPYTWPGCVLERCGFDHCVDLSYPGAGNEFIANSVLNYVQSLDQSQQSEIVIVVCWSGPDRKEDLISSTSPYAKGRATIDDVAYTRYQHTDKEYRTWYLGEVWRSWKNIIFLQNYLENKNIKFGFASYCNTVEPPFLPHRDKPQSFFGNLSQDKISQLQQCAWLHKFEKSFFEFCFFNDGCLSEDMFHPNPQGALLWTDQVLLPGMAQAGLTQKK